MNKKKGAGFANQVRQVLKEMASMQPVHVQDVARKLDLISNADKQPMYQTFRDFLKSGEIERTETDMFLYKGKKSDQKPELREILWRVLRARKAVTAEDLVELSGASPDYVKQWLMMLQRQEVISVRPSDKKSGVKTYVLVQDPVAMPTDDKKAEKLRETRSRKKEALNKLDAVINLCLEARMAVASLESGGAS
jgi:hypothetical protein